MICPKCGEEFVPGITECFDCGVNLVDRLPEGGLDTSEGAPMWTCSKCGEDSEDEFSACWSCGTGRDGGDPTPVFDSDSGDLILRTVNQSTLTLPRTDFEHMQRQTPLVASRLIESSACDWGWPATKLAEIDPDAVILHEVRCYHGVGNKGWLVATLDQMWWLEKGLLGSAEQPLSYDWLIEVSKRSRLSSAYGVGGGVPVGIKARRGVLTVGADQFQMHASEVDEYARLVRQMQLALEMLENSGSSLGDAAGADTPPPQPESPAVRLKELAELRDLGIVTEEEFQAKKAELLSKDW